MKTKAFKLRLNDGETFTLEVDSRSARSFALAKTYGQSGEFPLSHGLRLVTTIGEGMGGFTIHASQPHALLAVVFCCSESNADACWSAAEDMYLTVSDVALRANLPQFGQTWTSVPPEDYPWVVEIAVPANVDPDALEYAEKFADELVSALLLETPAAIAPRYLRTLLETGNDPTLFSDSSYSYDDLRTALKRSGLIDIVREKKGYQYYQRTVVTDTGRNALESWSQEMWEGWMKKEWGTG